MAKGIISQASKDDPIFNGGFVISSFPRQRVLQAKKKGQPMHDQERDARAKEARQQTKDKSTSANVPNSRKG